MMLVLLPVQVMVLWEIMWANQLLEVKRRTAPKPVRSKSSSSIRSSPPPLSFHQNDWQRYHHSCDLLYLFSLHCHSP